MHALTEIFQKLCIVCKRSDVENVSLEPDLPNLLDQFLLTSLYELARSRGEIVPGTSFEDWYELLKNPDAEIIDAQVVEPKVPALTDGK